jgi:hypothetical protein
MAPLQSIKTLLILLIIILRHKISFIRININIITKVNKILGKVINMKTQV